MQYLTASRDELIKAAEAEPTGSLARELVDALADERDYLSRIAALQQALETAVAELETLQQKVAA